MQSEITALQREVAALKQQVQGKRKRFKVRAIAAMLAAFVAFVPLSLLAANPFNDLVPGSVHNANIDAIYNAGITSGCVPNQSYCPTDLVTRQEMASFLARTAGLGGNQPVANARTVQGFTANTLVRTNANSNRNTVFLGSTFQPIAATTINIPAPGFVYVTAGTNASVGTNGYSARVAVHVRDVTANMVSYELFQDIGTASGTSQDASLSPTTVFQVTAPGTRTFTIDGAIVSGIGNPVAGYATISVLYVPFGPGGFQGAEVQDVNQGGGNFMPWPAR